MNRVKIILLCVFAAITYGVLHDQVTARVCIEYFTVAHPPIFHTDSPTMIALCWGVAATFGIGLVLGSLLALVGHSGDEPPLPASRLVAPIARLLAAMAIAALAAGMCGFFFVQRGIISVPRDVAEVISPDRHHRFMAAWFAHIASYLVGLVGGGRLVYRVWRTRGRVAVVSLLPHSRGAVIRTAIIAAIAAYVVWVRLVAR